MKNKQLFALAAMFLAAVPASAQQTPVSQMEKLDRGVVAVPIQNGGNFVSWRFFGTDDEDHTTFELLRNGSSVASNIYATNYKDTGGNSSSAYQVVTYVGGEPVDTSAVAQAWTQVYKPIKLDRPATGAQGGTYSPNDISVGDVDGDGQYELFVKWDPSTSKDNSQSGKTDKVFIDCYRLDGTKLWRIDLGVNIRAGAHYTQFMVYDFDGDGLAEMVCKTGPGSLDGEGNYVNQAATDAAIRAAVNTKDWRNSDGRIDGGQEYLTIFRGLTGAAIHTIAYNPNRNAKSELSEAAGSYNWGQPDGKNDKGSYGNRGERYLGAVAYLDGPDQRPSCIFSRGYYGYAYIWAVGFDGEHLYQKWLSRHESKTAYTLVTYKADGTSSSKTFTGLKPTHTAAANETFFGSGTMFGNGNHNLSIADVDGDGCDEIIWGSAALNNDGTLLYGTGFGHGDAIHLSDLNPERPGLEVFQVHEDKLTYAWDVHDAATGEILLKGGPDGKDNGRGIAAQLSASHHGFFFSSASERQQRSAVTGNVVSTGQTSVNFRIYWDGDLQDELLDGTKIDKWGGNGTSRVYINGKNPYDWNASSSCNSTKATPCLQADILGDWREEIILWSTTDNATINIFSTNTTTAYRMPTLMHDHVYRMGICWQNTAYNQPPHLGYYLPDAMRPRLLNDEKVVTGTVGQELHFASSMRYAKLASIFMSVLPDGSGLPMSLPEGFENTVDVAAGTFELTGTPQQEGDYKFVVRLTGLGRETASDTIVFRVVDPAGISNVPSAPDNRPVQLFDVAGRRLDFQSDRRQPGVVIMRRQTPDGIVTRKVAVGK